MDLMVVYDGDNFKEPWQVECPKHGSLSEWKFEFKPQGIASYRSVKDLSDGSQKIETKRAVRVWPPTLNEQDVVGPS